MWSQNNGSVSAVQIRPSCSVPAWHWLSECLDVYVNLEQSGTESTVSLNTVYCPLTLTSNALHTPVWGHLATADTCGAVVSLLVSCV